MPKVRSDKPKVSRAKKPRRAKAADDEVKRAASPLSLILETKSPTLLQMKALARHKMPQLNKRDEAAATVAEESLPAQMIAATLEVLAQRTLDRQNCEDLRCLDPVFQTSNETSSSQIVLPDLGTTNLMPLAEWSSGSDALLDAFSSIPGNEMSRDELRNVLDPISSCRSDLLADLRPANHACAPHGEKFLAMDEEPPSTPRGPATLVSVCHDFTLVTPPSSPPSPHRASEWDEDISATSTRRNLNFDTLEKELELEESEVVVSNDVEERDEPLGLIGSIADEESTQMAEDALTGFELVVRDQESLIPLAVPLEIHSSQTRVEELQIVTYDDGAKKMVVYKNPPMRKRRARYKPKVDLDISTVKMFKALTLKGTAEDDTEHDKASWDQSRQQWQDRALRFISIMRQVQGKS